MGGRVRIRTLCKHGGVWDTLVLLANSHFWVGLYNVDKSVALLAILMVICERHRIKIVLREMRHGCVFVLVSSC